MSKKKEIVVAKDDKAKPEMINVFKTSYHYYRNWVKQILTEGKIQGFRFLKDEVGWKGFLSVPKTNVEATKKVLTDFKTKHPDTIEMWW